LWEIAARSFEQGTGGHGELRVEGAATAWAEAPNGALSCTSLPRLTLPLQEGELKVVVYAEGAPIALDRIDLTLKAPSP